MEEPDLIAPANLEPTDPRPVDPAPITAAAQPEESPATDHTVEFRLHPDAVKIWTITAAVVAILPITGGTITTLVLDLYWVPPLIVAVAVLVVWLLSRYFRRYVASVSCHLSPHGLLVRRGVWWRAEIFVPRERVQHTDVDQGPFARRFGMASLKVFTAGSEHSQIEVDSLHHTEALAIRDDLIDRRSDEAAAE